MVVAQVPQGSCCKHALPMAGALQVLCTTSLPLRKNLLLRLLYADLRRKSLSCMRRRDG